MTGDPQVGAPDGIGRPHRTPTGPPSALGRCVDLETIDFAGRYWGRAALLTRARERRESTAGGFADLLDEVGVDELISRRGLRTPFLRMAKRGAVIDAQRYTRSGGIGATIADQVADDKVLDQLAGGATLVLQALHRTWPPLVSFGSALAAELGHPVQINAYVTPPQNQGFAAHYDNHDVFVLQVSGRKRWQIHEPVLVDPLPTQKWEQRRSAVAAKALEPPLIDTVLEPGDALYLPRGYLHSAAALGELSIHLTVGVHPLTRDTLVRRLLDAAASEPSLRGSLPMGVDLADPAVLSGHLRETATALAEFATRFDPARTDAIAAEIGALLATDTRPEPIGPLAQGAAAATLTRETPLRLRAGLRFSLETAAEEVVLRALDKTVRVPIAADSAVKQITDGAPFTPARLPGLDPPAQMELARRLLREGIVVPMRIVGPTR